MREYYSEYEMQDEINKFTTLTTDEHHYMNIEEIASDRTRITLKEETKKLLKKHPELLDCCK